jgi:transposase
MTHSTSPSTPATGETAIIYAAIELSSTNWLLAIQAPDREKVSRHQMSAGDSAKLVAHLEQARRRVQEQTDAPVAVLTCYEAGRDGFWLHRVLLANGIDNQIVDPASLLTDRKKKSAKTDRIDVHKILRALKLWHEGDTEACRMVHVPTPDQEDERRPVREAQRMKTQQTRHLNGIGSLLALHGIWTFKPLRRDWRAQLERLQTADGRPLPPRLKAEITRECERVHYLRGQLKELAREDRARRREAKRSAEGKQPEEKTALEQRAELIAHLQTLKGVGDVGASVLVDEVFFRDFDNRQELAGYVGLTPQPNSSGPREADQGLDKAGNALARWAMIELAWRWLQFQPDSYLSRWFHGRVGNARGRLRRIKLVAMARKLLVAFWRYVTQGIVPEDAVTTA